MNETAKANLPFRGASKPNSCYQYQLAVLTVIAGCAFLQAPARAAIIVTTEVVASSSASFIYQGVLYSGGGPPVVGIETASTQALAGYADTPEARNAARVNPAEIAANARLDGKTFFSPTDIQDNSSVLTYTGTIQKLSGGAENIFLNFYLPPSFVETTTNAEIPHAAVNPAIFASIHAGYCSSLNVCGVTTELFDFQAYLDSTWSSFSHFSSATGQAGMDLSPLLNPVLTDDYDQSEFFRTANLAFPGYAGTVDLGVLSAGQIIRFTYRMEARATGFASANVALAAINDPFFLDSDPVRPGAPVLITTAAVPESGTFAFLASGFALLLLRAKRSRRQ